MQSVYKVLGLFVVLVSPTYAQYRYGDIRLVGGSYQWEGRVEIFISGTWGTITDFEWSNNDAQVVCRKLGHFKPGASAHTGAYFGEGSGPIHLDFVQCSGSEYNLTECEIRHDRVRTSHSFDVGVKCQPADEAYKEGDIRLVGGSHNWEGRVEIYWTGTWGTISDTSWSDSDAEVVCRQLEHSVNGFVGRGYYGEGSGAIHIRDVTCSGSEINIINCNYSYNTDVKSHAFDVAVECQQGDDIKEGDIRLIPGRYLWQGHVEIFLDGVWGVINHAYTNEARVACRQLGYNTYGADYDYDYGWGEEISDLFHLTNLYCSGSEYRITDCYYDDYIDIISHSSYFSKWIVHCSVDGPNLRDVHLSAWYYGGVEVFLSGSWVPVTDTSMSWTLENSEVVCRELGYNGTEAYSPNRYTGTFGTMRELIDNVNCTGTESKLSDCSHNIIVQYSYTSPRVQCQHDECADGDIRLHGGESEMEGRVELCLNHRWGTVCDSQWTDNHTAVVCRHLGFSDIIGDSTYFTSEMFGKGSGPIHIDYISCNGSELGLWEPRYYWWYYGRRYCSSFTHYYGCSHSGDVGVRCQPASCFDGQIKLIRGRNGHVEICSNQRWETLSLSDWKDDEAKVACNSLGYSYGFYSDCCFESGGGPIHQKYFQCSGTEQELSQCDSYDVILQTNRDRAGIYCYEGCTDGEVRLVGGESEFEGRVEVCFNRRWGTVSSDGWTQTDTEVVCNDFGYDFTDGAVVNLSIPQALSKPVYLHNVVCSRSDISLVDCRFSQYSGQVNDVQYAIIACQQSSCKDGDLKLVGGVSENEGRLEVCFNQTWGTINGDGWTYADTQVACRQLGYSTLDVAFTKTRRIRSALSLPVHLTSVSCYGFEEMLINCTHYKYTSYISMDISISCNSKDRSSNSGESRNSTKGAESSMDSSSTKFENMSIASLSIAVILSSAFIVLVIVLIVRQRTKNNQSGREQRQLDTDIIRYATGGGIRNICFDKGNVDSLSCDDPVEDFGDEDPVTTKPQVKEPPV